MDTTFTYEEMVDFIAKLELIGQGEVKSGVLVDPSNVISVGIERMDEETYESLNRKNELVTENLARALQYALEIAFQPARVDVKDRKMFYTEREEGEY